MPKKQGQKHHKWRCIHCEEVFQCRPGLNYHRHMTRVVLASSWGQFQSWFLNNIHFFGFWCSHQFPQKNLMFLWNCFNFPTSSQSVPHHVPKNNNRKQLAKNGLHPHGGIWDSIQHSESVEHNNIFYKRHFRDIIGDSLIY